MDIVCDVIYKGKPFEVTKITGEIMQVSFGRAAEVAGASDG